MPDLQSETCPVPAEDFRSIAEILQHYINKFRSDAKSEFRYFHEMDLLSTMVKEAGTARYYDGKQWRKFSHQFPFRERTLKQATQVQQHEAEIKRCRTFQELIDLIGQTTKNIWGIGELYVYDTALRIGAKICRYPDLIYLHRGTREGAKNLGIATRRDSFPPAELLRISRAFGRWEVYEMEDVLCIYKRDLVRFAKN